MSNATADINSAIKVGQDGRRFSVPVDGGSKIYKNTLVAQLQATGMLVAATTAGAGPAIGIATHYVDNSAGSDGAERCLVETDVVVRLTNGATTDAFSEASILGSPVYLLDDHTGADNDNSGTLQQGGTFQGIDTDGKIRVKLSCEGARSGGLQIQAGAGTFAAGVLTVNAGITVTATSRVFAMRKTEAGTDGDEIRVPTADRVVGGPGTGSLVFRSFISGVAATSDTSTFEYLIVG